MSRRRAVSGNEMASRYTDSGDDGSREASRVEIVRDVLRCVLACLHCRRRPVFRAWRATRSTLCTDSSRWWRPSELGWPGLVLPEQACSSSMHAQAKQFDGSSDCRFRYNFVLSSLFVPTYDPLSFPVSAMFLMFLLTKHNIRDFYCVRRITSPVILCQNIEISSLTEMSHLATWN